METATVAHIAFLSTESDGSRHIYASYEQAYQRTPDAKMSIVYIACDRETGRIADGYAPWYDSPAEIYQAIQNRSFLYTSKQEVDEKRYLN